MGSSLPAVCLRLQQHQHPHFSYLAVPTADRGAFPPSNGSSVFIAYFLFPSGLSRPCLAHIHPTLYSTAQVSSQTFGESQDVERLQVQPLDGVFGLPMASFSRPLGPKSLSTLSLLSWLCRLYETGRSYQPSGCRRNAWSRS